MTIAQLDPVGKPTSADSTASIIDDLVKPLVQNLLQRNAALEEGWRTRQPTNDTELEHLQKQLEVAQESQTRASNRAEEAQWAMAEVERKNEQVTEELARLRKDYITQRALLKDVKKKLSTKTEEHTEVIRQLHAVRAELEQEQADREAAKKATGSGTSTPSADNEELAAARAAAALARKNEEQTQKALDRAHATIKRLEDEVTDARRDVRRAQRAAKKAPPSPAMVNLASVKKHLATARKQFDEDPDKSLMALDRAISLCDNGTKSEASS